MSSGKRPKMPLEDRAKIFSPFDPLQGFREALREKEREVEREAQAGDPRDRTGKDDLHESGTPI